MQGVTQQDRSPGSTDDLVELYDRFAPLVRSLAYDRLRDWHAACDVVHEVFLCLLNDPAHGRDKLRPQAWLLTVARNKIVDRRRDLQRRRERETLDHHVARPASNPAEQQQLEQLHRAIARLPENERVAVLLFYLEGIAAADIAEMTSVSLRTVYARLAQARRFLRDDLLKFRKEVCS